MTVLVKTNTLNFSQLWCLEIRRHPRREPELLDMTRVHAYSSHSYTSLRDVVACPLPAVSSTQWSSSSSQTASFQSLPDIRHVHMRNPLLEKAARAYLATASHTQHARMNGSGNMAASFSSFMKIIRSPFNSLFGGASTWLKQLYIKI
jgi:hypothetical protein